MTEQRSGSAASAPPTPLDVSLFEEGGVYFLRTQDGLALYRYDFDVDGKSHCLDACSKLWPPFMASDGATSVVGQWQTTQRGTARQWTYKGKPVYTYARDTPGAQAGDGSDGVWHVITP
jgi:predicted lipoprotein with Yx(FWY)xxD motif